MEAKLTEERAELVASNGLLDQNERLRAAIVAEEREKFESEKVLSRAFDFAFHQSVSGQCWTCCKRRGRSVVVPPCLRGLA